MQFGFKLRHILIRSLFIFQAEPALMYDSVQVFAVGLRTLEQSHALRPANLSCELEKPWDGGLSLINYINSVSSFFTNHYPIVINTTTFMKSKSLNNFFIQTLSVRILHICNPPKDHDKSKRVEIIYCANLFHRVLYVTYKNGIHSDGLF